MSVVIDKVVEEVPTAQEEGSQPSPEATETESSSVSEEEKLPFDEHPKWQSARATEQKVESIMEEHGYSNLDEMLSDLVSSKGLRQQVGNNDVQELVNAKQELEKIHAYWAEQKLLKQKDEDPDEYTATLERQVKELQGRKAQEEVERQQAEADKRFWNAYTKDATTFVENNATIDSEKEVLNAFLNPNSFVNAVDVQDKAQVVKMQKQVTSLIDKLKQDIIEEYRAGKIAIPKVTSTETPIASSQENSPKNIKEAGKLAAEYLRKNFGFK